MNSYSDYLNGDGFGAQPTWKKDEGDAVGLPFLDECNLLRQISGQSCHRFHRFRWFRWIHWFRCPYSNRSCCASLCAWNHLYFPFRRRQNFRRIHCPWSRWRPNLMSRCPNPTDRLSRFRIDPTVHYFRSLTVPQSTHFPNSIHFPNPNRRPNRIELKEVPQQSMEL